MDEGGGTHRVQVTLLGELRVRRDGAPVEVPGSRLRGLLALLALSAGRPVDPAGLVGALWPEVLPADPTNALQSLVSRLRRALGVAEVVTQTASGYRLAVAPDDIDVHRFERLAAAGRTRLRAGEAEAARELLGQAVALAKDPVAAEVAALAPTAGVRLAHARIEASADLAEADLMLGRYAEVGAQLPALLAEHPLDERLGGLLMDALAGQGREADALALYERIRHDLGEELGIDPGAALRDRHLRLLQDADRSGPAAPRPAAHRPAAMDPPGNLPAPVSSFVGRGDELDRVDALLDAGRLVTVIGPGGAGKTRLALEAARRRQQRYRDGSWLVDLASVTEPAEVMVAIVSAFDLRGAAMFEPRGAGRPDVRSLLALLVERLSSGEYLLLVDNCEHLVVPVAEVTGTLLRRCPSLRILATSREPLAVDGEALVPLGPLALPPAGADLDEALEAPAVRLFAERAAAVAPDFTLDTATVHDVVEVVRRLDGLPLALELAAARLRTLPLTELTAGLSDRFRLLTGGNRTALPRHRTLRAVIAWSWDLLSAEERAVAECVSVLPAGATPASAAAACAGTGVTPDQVPDLLAALVDRSLLRLAATPAERLTASARPAATPAERLTASARPAGPGPRYRMLETLREYGIERLAEQGTLTGVRDRAARYVATLVAELDPRLRGADQLPALRTLRAEYDNALAGLRHLCDSRDGPAALALATDLIWYWQMLGRHAETVFWMREVLADTTGMDPVRLDHARAIYLLNLRIIDPAAPAERDGGMREQLREIAARLIEPAAVAGPIGVLSAMTLVFAGDVAAARARVDRAAAGEDPWLASLARLLRARIAENYGDVAQVQRDTDEALAGFRSVGDRWGQAAVLPMRAMTRQYDGDLDGALADLDAARAVSAEFGSLDLSDEIFLQLRRCDLHQRRGEPELAAAALADARELARRSPPEIGILVDALEAGLLTRRGELDRAEELLRSAEEQLMPDGSPFSMLTGDHGIAIIGALKAGLALARGEPANAAAALAVAYPAALESQDMPILSMVGVGVAELAAALGDHRDAATLLGASARLRGAEDPTEPRIARMIRDARAALGDEAFDEAYAAGRSLDPQTARARVDPAHRPGPVPPVQSGQARRA